MTSTVNVPASNTWNTYVISSNEIPSDTTSVRIRFLQSTSGGDTNTYVTNCKLELQ